MPGAIMTVISSILADPTKISVVNTRDAVKEGGAGVYSNEMFSIYINPLLLRCHKST